MAGLDLFAPALQHRFHLHRELITQRTVDQTMVEGQRKIASGPYGDGVVHYHRLLHDAADPQNGYLRLVDHRRCEQAAEASEIGDGESPALYLVRL